MKMILDNLLYANSEAYIITWFMLSFVFQDSNKLVVNRNGYALKSHFLNTVADNNKRLLQWEVGIYYYIEFLYIPPLTEQLRITFRDTEFIIIDETNNS